MSSQLSPSFAAARRSFIEAGGQTTQSFGLGRIIGQTFALLYLSPKPVCLDEIVAELGVSKASVSTAVRQLSDWAAVKRVWVKGDRKDYYEAETEFTEIIRNGLLEIIRKKVNTAGIQLAKVEESLQDAPDGARSPTRDEAALLAARLARAKKFHQKLNGLLGNPLLEHLL